MHTGKQLVVLLLLLLLLLHSERVREEALGHYCRHPHLPPHSSASQLRIKLCCRWMQRAGKFYYMQYCGFTCRRYPYLGWVWMGEFILRPAFPLTH